MEDPESAGAPAAPGLSSLLPPREFLRSRKGQLLLAESVRTGQRGRGAAGAAPEAAETSAGSAGPTCPGPLPCVAEGNGTTAEGKTGVTTDGKTAERLPRGDGGATTEGKTEKLPYRSGGAAGLTA